MRAKFLIYQGDKFPFGITINSRVIKFHYRRDIKRAVLDAFIKRYVGKHSLVKQSTLHTNKFGITIKTSEKQCHELTELLESYPENLQLKNVNSFGRMFR